jgi:propionyl-CoA synthetase
MWHLEMSSGRPGEQPAIAHSASLAHSPSLSDVGWVVGHSYIVYGPLLHGCATVLYEGKPVGTPDAANFWRTIARHQVNVLFTAPTALRAIKRLDALGALSKQHDLSSFRALYLAGERADPDIIKWAEHTLHRRVIG